MDDDPDGGIHISDRLSSFLVDRKRISCVVQSLLHRLNLKNFEASVAFVDACEIRSLNREYRGKDCSTDVLSFPQIEFSEKPTLHSSFRLSGSGHFNVLGDVVISVADAHANAQKIGQSLDREIVFLLVHGILHLCGYDHEHPSDEQEMLEIQRQLVAKALGEPSNGAPKWAGCVSLVDNGR